MVRVNDKYSEEADPSDDEEEQLLLTVDDKREYFDIAGVDEVHGAAAVKFLELSAFVVR